MEILGNKIYGDFESLMLSYVLKKTGDVNDPDSRYSYPPLTTDSIMNNASLAQAIETFLTIVHVVEPAKSEKILKFMYGYKNSLLIDIDEDDLILERLTNDSNDTDDAAVNEAYNFLESIVK